MNYHMNVSYVQIVFKSIFYRLEQRSYNVLKTRSKMITIKITIKI